MSAGRIFSPGMSQPKSDYASSLTALHLANPRHFPKPSLNTLEDMGALLLKGSTNGGNFASVTRSKLLMT